MPAADGAGSGVRLCQDSIISGARCSDEFEIDLNCTPGPSGREALPCDGRGPWLQMRCRQRC